MNVSARAAASRLAAGAVAGACCAACVSGASNARAAAAPVAGAPRVIAPEPLPAGLLAAARAMEATRVSSERFSVQTAVASAGVHVPRAIERLLALLYDVRLSGEATSSPPAGAFQLTVFGQSLTLRVVRGRTYAFEPAIAVHDGGRPWVDLGRRGLGAVSGEAGQSPLGSSGEPESFARLAAALRAARAVRELGAGVVDGQSVMGYLAVVPSGLLQREARRATQQRGILGGVFGGGALPAAEPPNENLLLEVFVNAAGVPVRAHTSLTSEGFSFSALTDVYAIDFPLAVAPPPRRLTIGLAGLERIARERARRRRAARGPHGGDAG